MDGRSLKAEMPPKAGISNSKMSKGWGRTRRNQIRREISYDGKLRARDCLKQNRVAPEKKMLRTGTVLFYIRRRRLRLESGIDGRPRRSGVGRPASTWPALVWPELASMPSCVVGKREKKRESERKKDSKEGRIEDKN